MLVTDNEFSVLSIDQTDDIKDDNNHKKGIELPKPLISPRSILKLPKKSENEAAARPNQKQSPEAAVCPDKKVKPNSEAAEHS